MRQDIRQAIQKALYEHGGLIASSQTIEVIAVVVADMAIREERERLKPLLKRCEEIVDDDLENRPARHSLGRLHAELKHELA